MAELPPEFRLYELVKLTGWTYDQIEQAPAVVCDWLLRIDHVVAKVEADRKKA